MPKKLALLVSALVLVAMALRADDIVDEIIARVNDQIVTRSEMEKAKATGLEELKQRYPLIGRPDGESADRYPARSDRPAASPGTGQGPGHHRRDGSGEAAQPDAAADGLASIDDLEKRRRAGRSYEDFKEQIRISAVTQQVIGQEVGGKLHISNEDIQDWYNKHQKELEGRKKSA